MKKGLEKYLNKIICGNNIEVLKDFPDESIDMIMFSPPYYGLRDYGEETVLIWGGDDKCEHEWVEFKRKGISGGLKSEKLKIKGVENYRLVPDQLQNFCVKCGAWRGQLGLEPTWQMYIEHMMMLCKELKRVLKKEGSMYINIGDTYATKSMNWTKKYSDGATGRWTPENAIKRGVSGYKPKCLMGIPWRLAFALIEDGWILRNDIIWYKPNALPSSVKDRLTQTYEHIFHFVKNRKYYYDLDAIREPYKTEAPLAFNLRVRDVKRGKGGISVNGKLRASKKEVENYVYPESGRIRKLVNRVYKIAKQIRGTTSYQGKSIDLDGWRKLTSSLKAYREAIKILEEEEELSEEERKFLLDYVRNHAGNPLGKNPGDVISERVMSNLKYFTSRGSGGHYLYGGLDSNEAKHYHPLGKNPGDVCSLPNSKYLLEDVKTKSLSARVLKSIKEGKLTTSVRKALYDVGAYLKEKRKESGYSIKELAEITNIPQTTLEHYFRTDLSGQALPNKKVWDMLKPILKLGEYEDYIKEEIRSVLPMPHPLGKNPGDFWSITTKPFKGAHFAVYPPELCRRPILASCPPGGVVLDPFAGSGTTCVVARQLGRNYIGIELNPKYVEIAKKRLVQKYIINYFQDGNEE